MPPSILKRPSRIPPDRCACEVPVADRVGTIAENDRACGVLDLPRDQLVAVLELRMRDGFDAGAALASRHVAKLDALRRARKTTTSAASAAQKQDRKMTFVELETKAAKAQKKADRK